MRGVTHASWCPPCRFYISIHTPHAGSDKDDALVAREITEFQSTLPMRGVTGGCKGNLIVCFISIHTPHAGSDK